MTDEVIGRDAELSLIRRFLDRPAEGPRALVLKGEAGIGKSTLWLAGVAAARERAIAVLTSRPAETERTLPNLVLGDMFGDIAPDVLATLSAPRRRAFDSALLVRDAPDLPVDPRALGVAILTLLPVLASGRPLMLAIDDDQWADPSSAATLGFALRRLPSQPILLLVSRRIADGPAAALEEAIDPAEVERLSVGPLSVGAIQVLVRKRLAIAFPRSKLVRFHEVSGGNPFYALELARAQSLDPARDPTLPLAVPPSLERLVAARLRTLGAATRQALLLVAANGRVPLGLLGVLDVAPAALDPALAANVIETSAGAVSFTHPLLATAVYQGAPAERRRAAHRRLALAVVDPVQHGRHLALAADEPEEELAAALEAAGGIARKRGMPLAAAELAEHAVRLTPPDAVDDRCRRAIATARAHLEAGEGAHARAIASDIVPVAPAGRRRAEALVLRADLEAPRVALTLLRDAFMQAAGEPQLRAVILASLAEAGRYMGGRDQAEHYARASLRLAERVGDDELRAGALSIIALLRFEAGDPHALELAERASRLAARLADPRRVKGNGWMVGHVLTWSGSLERAREWLERQLVNWRDRDERIQSELLYYLALVEFWSGKWSIASEYADQVRGSGDQYGLEIPHEYFPAALIALHRGQFAVAIEHSRRALGLAGGQPLAAIDAVLAVCDLWRGSPATALVHFDEAEHKADARGWAEPLLRWWRAEYVEGLVQVGRTDDAERLVAEWESAAERLSRERVLALALRCRGLIAVGRGDVSSALDLLEGAIARHAVAGDRFGQARALLALGMAQRRARQKRTARASLEASRLGFEALGAMSWVATVRGELARIGGRSRIEGLSPSELGVAALVAEGRTNREIASALFLAERTVASHLTHIYAKLGIRSRTELARYLSARPELSANDASKVPTS